MLNKEYHSRRWHNWKPKGKILETNWIKHNFSIFKENSHNFSQNFYYWRGQEILGCLGGWEEVDASLEPALWSVEPGVVRGIDFLLMQYLENPSLEFMYMMRVDTKNFLLFPLISTYFMDIFLFRIIFCIFAYFNKFLHKLLIILIISLRLLGKSR